MILAILQARMTSPRLPGKAMAPLRGEPIEKKIVKMEITKNGVDIFPDKIIPQTATLT